MKKSLITLALSIALSQAACATVAVPPPYQAGQKSQQSADKPKTDKRQVFKGAGIGCAIGAGLSVVLGNRSDALKGCAVGAVAGGLVAYQKQLKEARELADQANASGMQATVQTREVTDKDGQKGEALNAITIKYVPADMQAMDQKTSATLDKIATLGKKAKNQLTFTFTGKKACEIPLAELRARGAFERHKVVNQCGTGASQIVITPVPEV